MFCLKSKTNQRQIILFHILHWYQFSSIAKLCICTCFGKKCHGKKTAGGCIDFIWSTNFQLILMQYPYLSELVGVSEQSCAIIIHPINIYIYIFFKSQLACF